MSRTGPDFSANMSGAGGKVVEAVKPRSQRPISGMLSKDKVCSYFLGGFVICCYVATLSQVRELMTHFLFLSEYSRF